MKKILSLFLLTSFSACSFSSASSSDLETGKSTSGRRLPTPPETRTENSTKKTPRTLPTPPTKENMQDDPSTKTSKSKRGKYYGSRVLNNFGGYQNNAPKRYAIVEKPDEEQPS